MFSLTHLLIQELKLIFVQLRRRDKFVWDKPQLIFIQQMLKFVEYVEYANAKLCPGT